MLNTAQQVKPVQYLGHGVGTGGLQRHSMGDQYPYTVVGTQAHADAPTQWYVMDCRTGKRGELRKTQHECNMDIASLRIRNMMHS